MEITNFEIIPISPLDEAIKRLNIVIGEKMIIIAGRNNAYFDGRIKSKLENGDRILVIKKDLSIVLHGPSGVKPLNWQKPQAGPIEFKIENSELVIIGQRSDSGSIPTASKPFDLTILNMNCIKSLRSSNQVQ